MSQTPDISDVPEDDAADVAAAIERIRALEERWAAYFAVKGEAVQENTARLRAERLVRAAGADEGLRLAKQFALRDNPEESIGYIISSPGCN